MKKSEMILKLSANLQKHENMLLGYAKGSITLKCTCDNLAIYLLKELDEYVWDPEDNPYQEEDDEERRH